MLDDALKELYDKWIKKWLRYHWKYVFTILLYVLYQCNFFISIVQAFGFNIVSLPRIPRIACFAISDTLYIVILLLMFKKDIKNGLRDLKKHFLDRTLLSLSCWLTGCVLMTVSSVIISLLIKQKVSTNEQLVRQSVEIAPAYMLYTCAIIAPIFEEMVFRKSLKGLIRFKWLFIIVSGLGFGLLHVIGSYTNPVEFVYIVPYGVMGCCFAYLLSKTNNITLPIIVHMLHNTILVSIQIITQLYGG